MFLMKTQLEELDFTSRSGIVVALLVRKTRFFHAIAHQNPVEFHAFEDINNLLVFVYGDCKFVLLLWFDDPDSLSGRRYFGTQVNVCGVEHVVGGEVVELFDDDGELRRKTGGEVSEGGEEVVVDGVGDEVIGDGSEEKGGGGE